MAEFQEYNRGTWRNGVGGGGRSDEVLRRVLSWDRVHVVTVRRETGSRYKSNGRGKAGI